MFSQRPARLRRRVSLLGVAALLAMLVLAPSAALAKSAARGGVASYYVITKAKTKCKAHYVKQTVTLRVRKHHRWVHVHQIRCVSTAGAGGPGGSGAPTFPANLPTAAVTVTAIPTAYADDYATDADQTLTVTADAGVLANDAGLDLTAGLVSGPAHGTVTLARSGAFHYVPAAGYSGIDYFSYRAANAAGENSGAAQVEIDVHPVAVAPSRYSVAAATTLNVAAPGLLAGAIGHGLRAQLLSAPDHGSASVNPDGSFTYTGTVGFAGSDVFTFEVVDADGQGSDPLTVNINVGAAPPTPLPQTFTGAIGNTEFQAGGARGGGAEVFAGAASALAGDSDPNGGSLSTTPGVIATTAGGTVTLASDGTFTYQPPAGFSGPSDSFAYTVDTSEGTSAPASATINFNPGLVWYVDRSAPAGGNGTSAAPFNSLAAVSSPGGAVGAGAEIFLFPGAYDGGVTLGANETLVGSPAGLEIDSENLLGPTGTNPVITNTNSGGVGVAVAAGDTVTAVSVIATSGAGISVSNADAFTINPSVSVSGAGGDGIDVSGGNGPATVAASISGSGGHSLEIQSRAGGTIAVTGTVSDDGNGILLQNNTGATIDFSGAITAATTNSHPAFAALGGGTVVATAPTSTLSATGAAALDVESTAIGSDGLLFHAISAGSSPTSGPAAGVVLDGTAPGSLIVTGSQAAGSGGTIQGTTADGVSAHNTGMVSLTNMTIEPAGGLGVSASVVPALDVSSTTITGGVTAVAASGDASTPQSPQTFSIEHNTMSGQSGTSIALTYAGNTLGYVLGNKIGSESPVLAGSTSGNGINVSPSNDGTMTAEVSANEVDEIAQGYGIDAQAPTANAVLNLTLGNNTVNMDSASSQDGVLVGSTGSVCLAPTSNIVTAAGSSASADAMELDQLTTSSTFSVQGWNGTGGPSALEGFLTTGNALSVGSGGGGSDVVATPDGSNGFTSGGTCPAPPPETGNI